jgi:hypothetical protein
MTERMLSLSPQSLWYLLSVPPMSVSLMQGLFLLVVGATQPSSPACLCSSLPTIVLYVETRHMLLLSLDRLYSHNIPLSKLGYALL